MSVDIVPVTPQSCEVLGYRVRATDAMWRGLDFSRAKIRTKSTIGAFLFGKEAPTDLHLDVPFLHPEDAVFGAKWADDQQWYRVRSRAEVGKKWRGKTVVKIEICRDDSLDPPWAFSIETRP